MASNELVGNIPTEDILSVLNSKNITTNINSELFDKCYNYSSEIFNKFK